MIGLFKNIEKYKSKQFNFQISFPKNSWKYRKFSSKELWFLNIERNEAIVLKISTDKVYNINELKTQKEHYKVELIGGEETIISYKIFEREKLIQYEWMMVVEDNLYTFTYAMVREKLEVDVAIDYKEIVTILDQIIW